MTQPLRHLEDTGKPRTGSNAGGRHQKYFLDEPGRRLCIAALRDCGYEVVEAPKP